jgi:hypothetical protein
MALNERPFADKVVEARHRAGQSGGRLFRRNSFYPGTAGHLYAFQHGGRWEPQLNLGFFAASRWGRNAIRAGIGFNLAQGEVDREREAGQERVLAHFDRFQQLVSSEWRQLLTEWMGAHGGFIQYGDRPPATDMLPKDAVDWPYRKSRRAPGGSSAALAVRRIGRRMPTRWRARRSWCGPSSRPTDLLPL